MTWSSREVPGSADPRGADRGERAALAGHARRDGSDGRRSRCGCCRFTSRGRCRVASAPRYRAPTAVLEPDSLVTPRVPPPGRPHHRGAPAMTARREMPPARRRPIPGMAVQPSCPQPPEPTATDDELGRRRGATPGPERLAASGSADAPARERNGRGSADRTRRPAADYAATRLVNFRLPVDLHDRFKAAGPRGRAAPSAVAAPEPDRAGDRAARGRPRGRR